MVLALLSCINDKLQDKKKEKFRFDQLFSHNSAVDMTVRRTLEMLVHQFSFVRP